MTTRSAALLALLVAAKLAFGLLVVLPATVPPPDRAEIERVTRIAGGSCRSCAAVGVPCPPGCRGATR